MYLDNLIPSMTTNVFGRRRSEMWDAVIASDSFQLAQLQMWILIIPLPFIARSVTASSSSGFPEPQRANHRRSSAIGRYCARPACLSQRAATTRAPVRRRRKRATAAGKPTRSVKWPREIEKAPASAVAGRAVFVAPAALNGPLAPIVGCNWSRLIDEGVRHCVAGGICGRTIEIALPGRLVVCVNCDRHPR